MSTGIRYQYCYDHKKLEEYPSCSTNTSGRGSHNAVIHPKDRPIVWEHPITKEVRYPGRNDGDIPKYYKDQGYQRKEIVSYQEHQRFNKEHGLINHAAEGIRDQADKEGR